MNGNEVHERQGQMTSKLLRQGGVSSFESWGTDLDRCEDDIMLMYRRLTSRSEPLSLKARLSSSKSCVSFQDRHELC